MSPRQNKDCHLRIRVVVSVSTAQSRCRYLLAGSLIRPKLTVRFAQQGSHMSKLKEALLKVQISKGAFKSECAVAISSIGGLVSLFTDINNIKTENSNSFMKVFVVETGDRELFKRILLPSETFETSSRWVDVGEEALIR
jgi:hypothetical protein